METLIARQAILTKAKKVFAYEVLFRSSEKNAYDPTVDGYTATSTVVVNAMLEFGLKTLTFGKYAFINFQERGLLDGTAELLMPEAACIEILETVQPTPEVIAACRRLKKKGYKLVLDDFVFAPGYEPLIELADIVKVDFRQTKTHEERKAMRKKIPQHVKLLAEKVETREEFEEAVALGYVLFQGYFFCKPTVLRKKAIPSNVMAQMQILKEINKEDIDFKSIKQVVERDPQLTNRLLVYINSPGIGIGTHIKDINQALVLLGLAGIRRWIGLIALRTIAADKPEELVNISLIRAKFCEYAAGLGRTKTISVDTAFLMGMFSLLDAMTNMTMTAALKEMNLEPELAAALLGEENALGEILGLVKAYESGNHLRVMDWCEKVDCDPMALLAIYKQSLLWASQITAIS